MPLTDEEYLTKYGRTREEGKALQKERQKKYMKKWYATKKKGKKTKRRKTRQGRGKTLIVREKILPVTARLTSGVVLPMQFTVEDLLALKQIEYGINELHAGAINNYLINKLNERNERRNGHG